NVCTGEDATDAGRDPGLRPEGLPADRGDLEPPVRAAPLDGGRGPLRGRAFRQEVLLPSVGRRGPRLPRGRRGGRAEPHALELPPAEVLDGPPSAPRLAAPRDRTDDVRDAECGAERPERHRHADLRTGKQDG